MEDEILQFNAIHVLEVSESETITVNGIKIHTKEEETETIIQVRNLPTKVSISFVKQMINNNAINKLIFQQHLPVVD